jgi:hypothetical protein
MARDLDYPVGEAPALVGLTMATSDFDDTLPLICAEFDRTRGRYIRFALPKTCPTA